MILRGLIVTCLALGLHANCSAALIVAFDQVRSSNGSDPLNYVVQDGVDVITTRSGTSSSGGANTPGVNKEGSTDGTIGSVAAAGVSTDTTINGESWRWTNGSQTANFDFDFTDTSGAARTVSTFHFDGGTNRPNVAQDWELFHVTGGGDVSLGTGTIPLVSGGALPEYTDFDVALGGLTLPANGTLSLSLRFTRDDTNSSSNGHHGYIDNIGLSVVPEPSSLALLTMMSVVALGRKRRS